MYYLRVCEMKWYFMNKNTIFDMITSLLITRPATLNRWMNGVHDHLLRGYSQLKIL